MASQVVVQSQPRFRYSGSTVTIVAGTGDASHSFLIHESVLNDASRFFRSAFSGQWTESLEKRMTLADDEPEVVAAYVHYLYQRTLPPEFVPVPDPELDSLSEKSNASSASGEDRETAEVKHSERPDRLLIACCIFGEKIQDLHFCAVVHSAILTGLESRFDWHLDFGDEDVKHLYSCTSPGSRSRKLFVSLYTWGAGASWFGTKLSSHDPQFLLDVAQALARHRSINGKKVAKLFELMQSE